MSDQNHDDNTRTHIVLTKGTMVSHYRIISKIGAVKRFRKEGEQSLSQGGSCGG